MPNETGDFLKNLPRDMHRVLKPEQQDYVAGRAESIYARNAIIISAMALCPLSAIFVSLALLANHEAEAMPDLLFAACLAYPLLGLMAIVLGLILHSYKAYTLSTLFSVVTPVLHVIGIILGFIGWAVLA